MTKEIAINVLNQIKELILNDKSWLESTHEPISQCFDMAIKSLEAWEKVEKEIDDSILICRESAQNNIWYDGELAGFLQSKDIIDGILSEVEI